MSASPAPSLLHRPHLLLVAACVLVSAAAGQRPAQPAADAVRVRAITWADVASLRPQLEAHGLTARAFRSHVEQLRRTNAGRVREGDLDHLVFYLLQSTKFTMLPPIEPALSAKEFVATAQVSAAVRSRVTAFVRAMESPSTDPRLAYFRELMRDTFPAPGQRQAGLLREYARVMRFLYEKEFVAPRSPRPADAVAELYRARGLSTDTAVEAGYLVYQGLAVLKSLEPGRRIRRVLIVGPGLDLAPRTALDETGPPESYQPWAVIDALLALGLAEATDLEVFAADINPRVVQHLRRSRLTPPVLTLVSEIQQSETVSLTEDYRSYFARLGTAIAAGEREPSTGSEKATLEKRVQVRADAAQLLRAARLDIVTERLEGPPFDLVIATNILPYFSDIELALAMSNVAAMLAPDGLFLHNEPRPSLGEITTAVGLPFEQSRQAVIATVRGAAGPLVDSVFLHRRTENVRRKE